ncbi:MAG: short-chain dehydrogenase [Bacteroidetes bacterium]|nr:short-chain dehydrogenase [Bacteroidota bacterium]
MARRNFWTKLRLYNAYYRRTGFYSFAVKNVLKVVGVILALVLALYVIDRYVIDVNATFEHLTQTLHPVYVYMLFFISETFFGLIPPDIFIAWGSSFEAQWLVLTFLAVISYGGGIAGYFLGHWSRKIPSLNRWLEKKFSKYSQHIRKWGGLVIIVAALFPLPFSTICILAGMVRYPFVPLLLFGLTRFARFYLYALAIFKVI